MKNRRGKREVGCATSKDFSKAQNSIFQIRIPRREARYQIGCICLVTLEPAPSGAATATRRGDFISSDWENLTSDGAPDRRQIEMEIENAERPCVIEGMAASRSNSRRSQNAPASYSDSRAPGVIQQVQYWSSLVVVARVSDGCCRDLCFAAGLLGNAIH